MATAERRPLSQRLGPETSSFGPT